MMQCNMIRHRLSQPENPGAAAFSRRARANGKLAGPRGDNRPDPDYDVAAYIKDPGNFTEEGMHLAEVTADSLFDADAVIPATRFRRVHIGSEPASWTNRAKTASTHAAGNR